MQEIQNTVVRIVTMCTLALLPRHESSCYTLPRETAAIMTMITTCCKKVFKKFWKTKYLHIGKAKGQKAKIMFG